MTEQDLGFRCPDLSAATAETADLGGLRFDDTQYADYEELTQKLGELPAKKRHILRAALSVNGKVSNDSMEKYLSARSYVSSSELKEVLKTPRHYLQYRDPVVKRDAKHFELGTFAHSAFLEPKKFDKVRVEPAASLSTKDGIMSMIEWYCTELCRPLPDLRIMKMNELRDELAALREEFDKAGFVSVSAEQKTIIECIRIAYKTYAGGILPRLLKLADAETSFYATDPASGINVRIRPDGLFLEENVGFNGILSLKTTSCQSIDAFARDCAKYMYDLSEGMYLDVASHVTGRQFTATIMVSLQTVAPYQIFMLWWSPESLESGKYKYHHALEVLAECRAKDYYPAFDSFAEEGGHGLIKFDLPNYAKLSVNEQNV